MLTFFRLVPRWAWLVAGGIGVSIALLILWQSAMGRAERRGYDRAMIEAAEAAAAASAAYQAQVDDAAKQLAASGAARRKAIQTARAETHAYYKANPAAAGVVCLPDDRVQAQTKARARIHSSATSGGRDSL